MFASEDILSDIDPFRLDLECSTIVGVDNVLVSIFFNHIIPKKRRFVAAFWQFAVLIRRSFAALKAPGEANNFWGAKR